MALTTVDRALLQRCLTRQPGAWNDFVDRFLGLIYHTIRHTAHLRSVDLRPEDIEDLAAEVLLQIIGNDYGLLKQFKGECSLATYLVVVARRICVHDLARRSAALEVQPARETDAEAANEEPRASVGLESLEEVQKLLGRLPSRERRVVALFYLEGRSYEEIATELNIPVNTIGPILSRARKKLRGSPAAAAPAKKRRPAPKTEE